MVAVATRKRESRGGVYKPLSVWVKKGYTEQQVVASPSEEDPVLGTTYAVQLHSVSEEQVQERLEEELLELEACAKQRARVKAKAKALPAAANAEVSKAAEEDDSSGNEDLDVLEPALQNLSKEEKDAARKAQREQARRFIAAKKQTSRQPYRARSILQ